MSIKIYYGMTQYRRLATAANESMTKMILEKHAKKNSYKIYSVGERVFIKIDKKLGKISKNYRILSGRMTKSYKDVTY